MRKANIEQIKSLDNILHSRNKMKSEKLLKKTKELIKNGER